MTEEEKLLKEFIDLKEKCDSVELELKAIKELRDKAESRLIQFLEDIGSQGTGVWDGCRALIVEGAAYASIASGMQDTVIEHMKSIGREDMIKTAIHSSSLSAFVREQLKQNNELPVGVNYYRPKKLRIYTKA